MSFITSTSGDQILRNFVVTGTAATNLLVANTLRARNVTAAVFNAQSASFRFADIEVANGQIFLSQDNVDDAGNIEIVESGNYALLDNIQGTIRIMTSNVCINLNCFGIDATGLDYGIEAVGVRNMTITGGLIQGATKANLFFRSCEQVILQQLRLFNHVDNGLHCIDCNGGFWTNLDIDGSDANGNAFSQRACLCVNCNNCTHVFCTMRRHRMTQMFPGTDSVDPYDFREGVGSPLTLPFSSGGICMCVACSNMKCDAVNFNENVRALTSPIYITGTTTPSVIPTNLGPPAVPSVNAPGCLCACYDCVDCVCNNCEHNLNVREDNQASSSFAVLMCVNSTNFICTNCRRNENVDNATLPARGDFYICTRINAEGCIDQICQCNNNIVTNPLQGIIGFDYCINVNGVFCDRLQCVGNRGALQAIPGALANADALGFVARTDMIVCGVQYVQSCIQENCQMHDNCLSHKVRNSYTDSFCKVIGAYCIGSVGGVCRNGRIQEILHLDTNSTGSDGVICAGCYFDLGGAVTKVDNMLIEGIGGYFKGAEFSWKEFKCEIAYGFGALCANIKMDNCIIGEVAGRSISIGVCGGVGDLSVSNTGIDNIYNSGEVSPTYGPAGFNLLARALCMGLVGQGSTFEARNTKVMVQGCAINTSVGFPPDGVPPIVGPFAGDMYGIAVGRYLENYIFGGPTGSFANLPPFFGLVPFESSGLSGFLAATGTPTQSYGVFIDNCNVSGWVSDLNQFGNSWRQFFFTPPNTPPNPALGQDEHTFLWDKSTGIFVFQQDNITIKNTSVNKVLTNSAASGQSAAVHLYECNNVCLTNNCIQDVVGIDQAEVVGIFLEGCSQVDLHKNDVQKVRRAVLVPAPVPFNANTTALDFAGAPASVMGSIYLKQSATPRECENGTIEQNKVVDGSGAGVLLVDATAHLALKDNKVITHPRGFDDQTTNAPRTTAYLKNYTQNVAGGSEYLAANGSISTLNYTINTGVLVGGPSDLHNIIAL